MLKTKIKDLIKNPDFILFLIFLLNLPIFGLLNRPIGKVWDLYSPIDDLIYFDLSLVVSFFTG